MSGAREAQARQGAAMRNEAQARQGAAMRNASPAGRNKKEEFHTASDKRIGNRRTRLPVAANNALAIAGAAQGTPGSPIPPDFSLLSTMCVSISGHSFIRSIGNE